METKIEKFDVSLYNLLGMLSSRDSRISGTRSSSFYYGQIKQMLGRLKCLYEMCL